MNLQYIAKFGVELIISLAVGLLADAIIDKIKDNDFKNVMRGFELGREYYEYNKAE